MDKKAEKLKSLIKRRADKSSFGTDPNEPWSAKAGITEENLSEDELLNTYLKTKGLNPKTASKISKISASKTGDFDKWKRNHMQAGRLPDVRKEAIEGLPIVKGSENITAKRQSQLKQRKSMHKVVVTPGLRKEGVDKKDTVTMDIPLLIRVLELAREDVKDDDDLHRVVEKLIDIRNKGTLTMDDYNFIAKLKEDVYQDPKAATQTVFDGGNNTNDTCSKAAKLIKSIYKKKVNEALYDHEKEDKSVATYGKKPKHEKADKKDSDGENKPSAAAVITGGTTLTGQKRDDIEIDPMMRNRPGQPDITKKKDKEKQDNKKDK